MDVGLSKHKVLIKEQQCCHTRNNES